MIINSSKDQVNGLTSPIHCGLYKDHGSESYSPHVSWLDICCLMTACSGRLSVQVLEVVNQWSMETRIGHCYSDSVSGLKAGTGDSQIMDC